MTVIAIEDIKDFKRNIMAKKGDTLKVTADYWNVWIMFNRSCSVAVAANGLRLCDVPHSRMLKISTKVHSGILQNRCYGLAFNDNALDGLCKIHNK